MAHKGKGVDKPASDGEQRFTLNQLQQLLEAMHLVSEQEAERQMWQDVEDDSHPMVSGPFPSSESSTSSAAGSSSQAGGGAPAAASPASVPLARPAFPGSSSACRRGAGRGTLPTAVGNNEHTGGHCGNFHRPIEETEPRGNVGTVRWYCITRGQAVGIFRDWMLVAPLVIGVPNAVFQRYPTFGAALAAFMRAAENGNVAVIM
ncbi:uncharacterized protein B0H18DRAFT_1126273 [Fomitopsis serialis]|uniref:uncharacterized protein n=1 Tax=Fomitopsis serialis TaxID=139415 RepID=UPI002008D15F|nr:uncharacterized protein B0H18DRAFT_1126273 [Neoantrodia serialis]KAH9913410.1 hypothetical protein B0H18DRAFT_1126273 [Neoantrodia serialis]